MKAFLELVEVVFTSVDQIITQAVYFMAAAAEFLQLLKGIHRNKALMHSRLC